MSLYTQDIERHGIVAPSCVMRITDDGGFDMLLLAWANTVFHGCKQSFDTGVVQGSNTPLRAHAYVLNIIPEFGLGLLLLGQ